MDDGPIEPRMIRAVHSPTARWIFILAGAAALVATLALLVWGLWTANAGYSQVRSLADQYLDGRLGVLPTRPDLAFLYSLQAARANDALFMKSLGIGLSFVIVFVGALGTLTGAQAGYEAAVKTGDASTFVKTTSPGLVIITAGTVLAAISLSFKTEVNTQFTWGLAPAGLVERPATDAKAEKPTEAPTGTTSPTIPGHAGF